MFSGTIAPHVAFRPPSQVSIDFCNKCTTSTCVLPGDAVWMRSVSLMKEYPTNLALVFEIGEVAS